MKLIGLDIDGPIVSMRGTVAKLNAVNAVATSQLRCLVGDEEGFLPYGVEQALKGVDPVAVALVNRLCVKHDARILLTSTHRQHFVSSTCPLGSDLHMLYMRTYMSALGLDGDRLVGVTPILHARRGEEVDEWYHPNYSPDDAVFFDDSSDYSPHHNLIQCTFDAGIDVCHYQQADNILGRTNTSIILP